MRFNSKKYDELFPREELKTGTLIDEEDSMIEGTDDEEVEEVKTTPKIIKQEERSTDEDGNTGIDEPIVE